MLAAHQRAQRKDHGHSRIQSQWKRTMSCRVSRDQWGWEMSRVWCVVAQRMQTSVIRRGGTDRTVTYRVNSSFLSESVHWSQHVLFHWLCIRECPWSLRCAPWCAPNILYSSAVSLQCPCVCSSIDYRFQFHSALRLSFVPPPMMWLQCICECPVMTLSSNPF